MKKKIIVIIASLVVIITVVSYFVDGPKTYIRNGVTYTNEYSIMNSITLLRFQEFPDIFKTFRSLVSDVTSIQDWGSLDIEWYEYIPLFFNWLGNILAFPILLLRDFVEVIFAIFNSIITFFTCWHNVEVI